MKVKHLFSSLMERLDGIENEWVDAPSGRKQELQNQLMELRQVSDEILDRWLDFEERMVNLQRLSRQLDSTDDLSDFCSNMDVEIDSISDNVAEQLFKQIKELHTPESNQEQFAAYLSGQAAHAFRKGQGYYDLFMYSHAANYFKGVVEQDPDLDIARLYLGFSLMMEGQAEEAQHHFHLISQTTGNKLVKAIVENAQGCLFAANEKWNKSLICFSHAVDAYPKLKEPLFNKALALMKLNDYAQAESVWKIYCEDVLQDWEAMLYLATCYQAEGNGQEAQELLGYVSKMTGDTEILWRAGQEFENLRQFGNASLCYRMLLQEDSSQAAAWHGLGWNLWHAEENMESVNYIKKALTLSPKNPDFLFSLGWILLHNGELEEAERMFDFILEQEPSYSLAIAGMVQVCLVKEHWERAELYCNKLIALEHQPSKGLGHMQMGRLYLIKGDYAAADHHFHASITENPEMKDSYLLLGLVRYLNGDREEAAKLWDCIL
jgi:tetratricopeptide (TPR) repeat protein